jgi:ribonuclease HI
MSSFTTVVYSDGSFFRDAGRCGYAAVVLGVQGYIHGKEPEGFVESACFVAGARNNATSQIGELLGASRGLATAWQIMRDWGLGTDPEPPILYTDSRYVQNIPNWSPKWEENDWQTSTGAGVANRALVQKLIKELSRTYRDVKGKKQHVSARVYHVPGHAGYKLNELADRLAGVAKARGAMRDYDMVVTLPDFVTTDIDTATDRIYDMMGAL